MGQSVQAGFSKFILQLSYGTRIMHAFNHGVGQTILIATHMKSAPKKKGGAAANQTSTATEQPDVDMNAKRRLDDVVFSMMDGDLSDSNAYGLETNLPDVLPKKASVSAIHANGGIELEVNKSRYLLKHRNGYLQDDYTAVPINSTQDLLDMVS